MENTTTKCIIRLIDVLWIKKLLGKLLKFFVITKERNFMQHIKVRRGKLGRWRWFLIREGKHMAMCGIWGYKTKGEAEQAAVKAFSSKVEMEKADGFYFAGDRDFEN